MKNTSFLLSMYGVCMLIFNINCQNPNSTSNTTTVSNNTPSVQPLMSDTTKNKSLKINGLCFVATPRPFSHKAMIEVKQHNAGWIAVIPYAFTRPNEPMVRYHDEGQWWGERVSGVCATIDSAHRSGLKVMLKPQVYVPGSWTGGLEFQTENDWAQWEKDYEKYLMRFVKIADSCKVNMLCIGTEFGRMVVKREAFWRSLIQKVREIYKGKLVYAANWDEYERVPFWDALDFVGIDAYFSLVNKPTPSVSELREAWKPYLQLLQAFHNKVKKDIIFTEYGYMSIDGCAYQSWAVEKQVHETNINEQAQANALEGLYATFWEQKWWAGGFIWKWFPDGQGHEGYPAKDYTPQGKRAAAVLSKWYKQE
jgi:hypothetical protein